MASVDALGSCMTADYLREKQDEVRSLAKRIEEDLFRKANSKEEYYSSLAAKIFKLNQAATSNPAGVCVCVCLSVCVCVFVCVCLSVSLSVCVSV